jgi:hypothetical protein
LYLLLHNGDGPNQAAYVSYSLQNYLPVEERQFFNWTSGVFTYKIMFITKQ